MTLGSSHHRSYQPNEFPHAFGILDTLARLYSAADIDGEGPHLSNSLLNIFRGQSASKYQRLSQIGWNQRPVKYLARPTRNASDKGIEQNGAGPDIAGSLHPNVLTWFDPERLVPWAVKTFAIGRCFVTVKLQHIQRHGIERFVEFATRCINEQPYGRDERWQGGNDSTRLLDVYRPRTLGIEHQTDRIRAGFGRNKRIFNPGDSTYLATNDRQRQVPAIEDAGW